MKKVLSILAVLLIASVASAAIDTNTTDWSVAPAAPGPVTYLTLLPSSWVSAPNWISTNSQKGLATKDVLYTFTFTGSLGIPVGGAILSGDWAADGQADLKVDGVTKASLPVGQYGALTPFSFVLSTGAANVITVEVYNGGEIDPNPMGLLITNSELSAIPAPGAILLAGLGSGLVGWMRRRRSF